MAFKLPTKSLDRSNFATPAGGHNEEEPEEDTQPEAVGRVKMRVCLSDHYSL
jgi:hypothetical protein